MLFSLGILDQSAVWVDEMNYYDMRTDRNKGIPPLSLRPANPLGIEIDKWVPNAFNPLFFLVFLSVHVFVNFRSFNNLRGRKRFKNACALADGVVFRTQKSSWYTVSPASQSIFASLIRSVDKKTVDLKVWCIELHWCLYFEDW